MTKKEIFAIVNSIRVVKFTELSGEIRFKFIADSRMSKKIKGELNRLIERFKEKATANNLSYYMGDPYYIDFLDEEGTKQWRVDIKIYLK
jgi:hypothetical protein